MNKELLENYENLTILKAFVEDLESAFIKHGYINQKVIDKVLQPYKKLTIYIPDITPYKKEQLREQLTKIKTLTPHEIKRLTYTFEVGKAYIQKEFEEIKKVN